MTFLRFINKIQKEYAILRIMYPKVYEANGFRKHESNLKCIDI